jgi:hypothetical protein
MAEYKGTAGDVSRIKLLSSQREKQKKQFLEQKDKIKHQHSTTLAPIQAKFATTSDSIEEQFKQQTIGLVSSEDFKRKREILEKQHEDQKKQEEEYV